MHADEYTAAAIECSTLLDTDVAAWEHWIGVFAAADRIEAIAYYIPTGNSSSSSSGTQQGRGALAGAYSTYSNRILLTCTFTLHYCCCSGVSTSYMQACT
jgi:hypothetical protein